MKRRKSAWTGVLQLLMVLTLVAGILGVWVGQGNPPGSVGHKIFLSGMICCAIFAVSLVLLVFGVILFGVVKRNTESLGRGQDDLIDLLIDDE